jgi:acyl-CoA synthetase (NDP forming)
MAKISKNFFTNGEVLFVGYSGENSKNSAFGKQVYQAFMRGGIKVYPLNNKKTGRYDIKVYHDLSEIPKLPKCAYVLLNKDNSRQIIKPLAANGIKRILFQNKKNVTPDMLAECEKMGIETAVACPMMIFGSGIHMIHGFFAGVR